MVLKMRINLPIMENSKKQFIYCRIADSRKSAWAKAHPTVIIRKSAWAKAHPTVIIRSALTLLAIIGFGGCGPAIYESSSDVAGRRTVVNEPVGRFEMIAQSQQVGKANSSVASTVSETTSVYLPAARVNGKEISTDRIVEVLLRGRGRGVLDNLISLELARQKTASEGITDFAGIRADQMDRLLEDMAPGKAENEKQALLEYLLKSRGLTRKEFELIIERQGLLRRLVEDQVQFDQSQLEKEFQHLYGRKVEIRQLIVSNLRCMNQALTRRDGGEDFVQIIREMSEDQRSLAKDGLTGLFSSADEQVPEVVRQTALKMEQISQMSEPIHYQDEMGRDWWCLFRLERIAPAEAVEFDQVRAELERSARERQINQRMLQLQQQLQQEASIEIINPIFKKP